MKSRKDKVANWYLDMSMIAAYLFTQGGAPRTYHLKHRAKNTTPTPAPFVKRPRFKPPLPPSISSLKHPRPTHHEQRARACKDEGAQGQGGQLVP